MPAEAGLVVHHGAVGADDIEAALLCGGEGLARVGRLVESHLADAAVCPFGDSFGGLLGQLEHGGVDLLAQRSEVGRRVFAHEVGFGLRALGERHEEPVAAVGDVTVGEQEAVAREDEPSEPLLAYDGTRCGRPSTRR